MGSKCVRALLTLLHGLIGLAAGFFCLYSLFSWYSPSTCLPELGNIVTFQNGLPMLCDSLVYGMGAVGGLNFLMCVLNNCLFNNTCVAFFHMSLTTMFMAFSVMGGSVVTVYYIMWCDVLQQTVVGSTGCQDAATRFDIMNSTAHMGIYKTRMEFQMASAWAVFPLTCFAMMVYTLILHTFAEPEDSERQLRYILLRDERTPLLAPINREPIQIVVNDRSQADTRNESTNQPAN